MNLLSITMDKNRCLSPDAYTLGVERDHQIDRIVLSTDKSFNETSIADSTVSLHLKAEDGYTYNAVCEESFVEGDRVYFIFPVTREMTCTSGNVKIEFHFDNPSVAFSFTSRSADFIIAKPLTDTDKVQSDYPGMLSDVLSTVAGFSSKISNTQSQVSTLDTMVGELFDTQNENTRAIKRVEAFVGYTDADILGLEADFENNTFTRLAGARGLEAGADFDGFAMYKRRRCNVGDNGSILAYFGDEGYRDDGTNGQVMVYQPKFYYRVVPIKLEKQKNEGYHILKANYYICATPKIGFKLHPAFYDAEGKEADYILFSAYEGSVENSLLRSVSGAKPACSYSRSEFENLAKGRGEGWHIETIKAVSANQLLMLIEFASFNAQSAIGKGVCDFGISTTVNRASYTGSTASLGNGTGCADETVNEISGVEVTYTDEGKTAVSYRGMENVWGNIYKFATGVTAIGKGESKTMTICDNFSFTDAGNTSDYHEVAFSTTSIQSYITSFGFGNEYYDWVFLPSYLERLAATSEHPVGDNTVIDAASYTGYRNFFYGGHWGNGVAAGVFSYHTQNSVTGKYTFVGARLMYVKGV